MASGRPTVEGRTQRCTSGMYPCIVCLSIGRTDRSITQLIHHPPCDNPSLVYFVPMMTSQPRHDDAHREIQQMKMNLCETSLTRRCSRYVNTLTAPSFGCCFVFCPSAKRVMRTSSQQLHCTCKPLGWVEVAVASSSTCTSS